MQQGDPEQVDVEIGLERARAVAHAHRYPFGFDGKSGLFVHGGLPPYPLGNRMVRSVWSGLIVSLHSWKASAAPRALYSCARGVTKPRV